MSAERPDWLALLLAVLVALQIGIPAAYYLTGGGEDERFRWRMFSAIRLRRCSVQVLEGASAETLSPVNLSRSYHSAWRASLQRGRERVIERVLENRCEMLPGGLVQLVRQCREPDGKLVQLPVEERRCALADPPQSGSGS